MKRLTKLIGNGTTNLKVTQKLINLVLDLNSKINLNGKKARQIYFNLTNIYYLNTITKLNSQNISYG